MHITSLFLPTLLILLPYTSAVSTNVQHGQQQIMAETSTVMQTLSPTLSPTSETNCSGNFTATAYLSTYCTQWISQTSLCNFNESCEIGRPTQNIQMATINGAQISANEQFTFTNISGFSQCGNMIQPSNCTSNNVQSISLSLQGLKIVSSVTILNTTSYQASATIASYDNACLNTTYANENTSVCTGPYAASTAALLLPTLIGNCTIHKNCVLSSYNNVFNDQLFGSLQYIDNVPGFIVNFKNLPDPVAQECVEEVFLNQEIPICNPKGNNDTPCQLFYISVTTNAIPGTPGNQNFCKPSAGISVFDTAWQVQVFVALIAIIIVVF